MAVITTGSWVIFGGNTAERPLQTQPAQPPNDGSLQSIPPANLDTTEVPVTDLTTGDLVPEDVPGMLARANEYVRVGILEKGRRMVDPPGDNAVDLYLRVLSVDQENAEARAGLDQVAAPHG